MKPFNPGRPALMLLMSLVAWSALADAAPGAKRALTPDDIYRFETVSDPQVSPDGQWVAYLVATNDRDADEVRTAIWMVSWDGTQHVRLTGPASSASAPHWSPDGRYLSYLARPSDAEHSQVMLLDRRGGEPRALTHVSDDIESYAWSPDGKRLALVIVSDSDAPTDAAAAKNPRPIVIDTMYFKNEYFGYIGRGQKQHLFLFDLATEKLEPLSNEPQYNDVQPAWSPDGQLIAFARTHERDEDMDGKMDIEVIEARPGAVPRRLVRPYAPNFQRLAWSPDGRDLAYLQGREPKYSMYMHDELAMMPAVGGAPNVLTGKLDRWIYSYEFSADGKAITVLVEDDRSRYLARLNLTNNTFEQLIARPLVVAEQSVAGAHLAILASDDRTASEVYALEAGGMRQLTRHGEKLLDEIELGAVEDLNFKSRDGTEIHGMLVRPPGFVPGRKYPTILWIHGGPDLQDEHSTDFTFSYQFMRQLLAANGYVVFGVNYRGSSGRGFEFANSIFADWGHKEVEDLLAGVDTVVARGLADPARLGIGGTSYGSMLTNYTISRDQRFKAAVSGWGTGNEFAMYGTNQYIMQDNFELGPPWRDIALWSKVSYPLLHANQIHTPTLFMGSDRDFNVPVAGSEQMYQALRTLAVPTELIVYPGERHGVDRPTFQKDELERIAAWFGKYLQPGQ